MTDRLGEQLSAWMDGELAEEEIPLLLERLRRDPALRARLGRYHLIGEAIRRGLPERIDTAFPERLQARIEEDAPAQVAPDVAEPSRRGGLRWAAVAAAAAVMVLAGLMLALRQGEGPRPEAVPVASAEQPDSELWIREEAGMRRTLDRYLVDHSEAVVGTGAMGVPPYVRIVGYEDAR